jgi:excisionase family DNA binding protein
MSAERCLTIAEAAEWLSVDHKTVRRMVERGEIPALRVGRVWRIEPEEIRAALAHRPAAPSSALRPRPRPVTGELSRLARDRG